MAFMPLKTDGLKLAELRERNGLTQAELAELIGYNSTYIGLIECGAENAGPKFLKAAVEVLGCTIDDITDGFVPRRRRRPDRAEAS